jgi:uncharacterized protein (DUF362 family)
MRSGNMPVAVVRYDGTSAALKKAIELSNGFERLRPDSKVLLKPNIAWAGRASRSSPKFGTVTTARVAEDLIRLLREYGCRDICIGEGTVLNRELGSNTSGGYRLSGMERVARQYGVRLIDFHQEPFTAVELDGVEIRISAVALESDFLINIPVLKTHSQTKVSLGLKNLKGCLDMRSRMEFHRRDLDRFIARLNTRVRPQLTVIDGIYAMECGPDFLGTAHRTNLIIAGRDSFLCDLVGSMILGIEPSSVGYLAEFASIEKRSMDRDSVEVRGERIEDVMLNLGWQRDFGEIMRQVSVKGLKFQDGGKSYCSGCLAPLESVLVAYSKDNPGVDLGGVEICFGGQVRPDKRSRKVFLVGNCSIQANRDFEGAVRIKGCPIGVRDAFYAFTRHTLGGRKTRRLMAIRFLKNLANRAGIYDEDFPLYRRYSPGEFDEGHFS